jgi:hypothetical protein
MLPEKVTLPNWMGCVSGSCASAGVPTNRNRKQMSSLFTKSPDKMGSKQLNLGLSGRSSPQARPRAGESQHFLDITNLIRLAGVEIRGLQGKSGVSVLGKHMSAIIEKY